MNTLKNIGIAVIFCLITHKAKNIACLATPNASLDRYFWCTFFDTQSIDHIFRQKLSRVSLVVVVYAKNVEAHQKASCLFISRLANFTLLSTTLVLTTCSATSNASIDRYFDVLFSIHNLLITFSNRNCLVSLLRLQSTQKNVEAHQKASCLFISRLTYFTLLPTLVWPAPLKLCVKGCWH